MAYLISYAARFSIINRIGQKLKATKRYGDEDVWHYFHNAPDTQKNEGWVIIRDIKAELAYYCYISAWSDTGKNRELILSEVSVYTNDSSDFLYDAQHIYLSRNNDEITIEVPTPMAQNNNRYKTVEK
ncbi:MAG: hypothetical protein R6V10_00025 [bacterium]